MARWQKPKPPRPSTEPAALRIGELIYPIPLDFTIGEGRAIKRITGLTMSEFARQVERDASDADVTTVLAWLVLHREDASVTVEDVEALLYSELGVVA